MDELQYEKAIKEYNLDIKDLPEDCKIAIEEVKKVLQGVRLCEKTGKTVSEKVRSKLRAMDKFAYYEILDVVNETDNNDDDLPHSSEEVIKELKKEKPTPLPAKPTPKPAVTKKAPVVAKTSEGSTEIGKKIDEALEKAYQTGKKEYSLDEIKAISPQAFKAIFDGYDESGDNGLKTSNFSLIETEENMFTLSKV